HNPIPGVRFPRWFSACITSLQLAQMFGGCAVCYYAYNEITNGRPCLQSWENVYLGVAMYASYFVLFAHYFYEAYIGDGKRKRLERVVECNGESKNGKVHKE